MPELHLPWLEIAILLPLIGSLIVRFPKDREKARRISVGFAFLTLLAAVGEFADFLRLGQFEAHDHWDIVASFMHQNVLVIDELSAPLFPLAALLYLLTIYSTLKTKVTRFSMSGTLISEAILLATFSCRSGWLLIFLLALGVVPVYHELAVRRKESVRVFVIHMALFVGCMAVGYAILPSDAASHPDNPRLITLVGGALIDVRCSDSQRHRAGALLDDRPVRSSDFWDSTPDRRSDAGCLCDHAFGSAGCANLGHAIDRDCFAHHRCLRRCNGGR